MSKKISNLTEKNSAMIAIIVLIFFSRNTINGAETNVNSSLSSKIDDAIDQGANNWKLISRDQWLAQPPISELFEQKVPVNKVIITHTATDVCNTQGQCTFRVRFMQTYHIESRGFDDIGYNFMIGGDGGVYEGRGWDKVGAHTKGFNIDSIGIAFIGTFAKIKPEPRQVDAAKLLIEKGVELGKIVPDYKLYGQRQLIASESPGEVLFNIIKQWPHWVNTTY